MNLLLSLTEADQASLPDPESGHGLPQRGEMLHPFLYLTNLFISLG